MADMLTRLSPLQSWHARLATLPESATLAEESFLAMVDLWVDPTGPGAAAAAHLVGIDALPPDASTTVVGPEVTVIWFGPQEWLVISSSRDAAVLETRLRDGVREHGGAAVDVSAQRTTLRLRGANARAVLAKGCSLDLHPKVFRRATSAQTTLGLSAVVLIALDDAGTDYRLLVRSSFARYVAEWLIDAAAEFGEALASG